MALKDEKFELIRDPQESLDTFAQILKTGRSLYPKSDCRKGSPRECRIVPPKKK